jgi:hypothetical protein
MKYREIFTAFHRTNLALLFYWLLFTLPAAGVVIAQTIIVIMISTLPDITWMRQTSVLHPGMDKSG